MLKNYDKDNISAQTVKKLEAVCISNPDFNRENMERCNVATKFLYLWVNAMYEYYTVYTTTKPLREKLESMRKILNEK